MNFDAVLLGSIASVVIACVVFGFLVYKVGQLMKKDGEDEK